MGGHSKKKTWSHGRLFSLILGFLTDKCQISSWHIFYMDICFRSNQFSVLGDGDTAPDPRGGSGGHVPPDRFDLRRVQRLVRRRAGQSGGHPPPGLLRIPLNFVRDAVPRRLLLFFRKQYVR